MPHPYANPDADTIYNRISISLAKSQRLFSSLPPDTNPHPTKTPSASESEPEETLPPLLGIGATPPSPTPSATELRSDKTSLAADTLLREQLFGKDWARYKVGIKGKAGGRTTVSKSAGAGAGAGRAIGRERKLGTTNFGGSAGEEEDGDGDEGGRSFLGKGKGKGEGKSGGGGAVGDGDGGGWEGDDGKGAGGKGVKRARNYLDEVLAERVEKKKRRKKGRRNDGGERS